MKRPKGAGVIGYSTDEQHINYHTAKATAGLIKLASDWMRTKGARITWAWVRENDYGRGDKGSHVHIMLHCSARLPIARYFRRWPQGDGQAVSARRNRYRKDSAAFRWVQRK